MRLSVSFLKWQDENRLRLYQFCPACNMYTDEDGAKTMDLPFMARVYEQTDFCPECIATAKDIMFDDEIPLYDALMQLLTRRQLNDEAIIRAAKRAVDHSTHTLFDTLLALRPPSEEQVFDLEHSIKYS